ncbi:MAG: peptidylprolyl isomerase [Cyanobacteria bacterium P01_F01_bin.150]
MTIDINPINDIAAVENAANTTINLFNQFDDPRTTGLVAEFKLYKTELAGGITNVLLFDQTGAGAPLTVQNFISYVEDDAYTNSIIHRSVSGFVVQGGGFTFENLQDEAIVTDDPVQNEPSSERSNLRGTIAMAKLGGNPNSATSQWFFNLDDNSANLDRQNGGFTVFGEVLGEADLAVIDAIAALRVVNGSAINGAFSELPVDSEDNTLDNDEELVRYRSISVFQRDELTFEVLSNSNSSVANVGISSGQLVLDYLQPGTTEVVVRATNLLGQTADDTFIITVDGAPEPEPSNPEVTNPAPPSPEVAEPEVTNPEVAEPEVTEPSVVFSTALPPIPVPTENADNLSGGDGDNEINGAGGNDIIFGLNGDDRLIGGGGQDRLVGGNGEDDLSGGGGRDNLRGGNGADTLSGGGGNDKLNGGKGNDELLGGGGNDTLRGGRGRDLLDGGKGNNVLIGGRDRDIFVLSPGKGRSLIRDFKDGQDRLQVNGLSFGSLTIEQSGRNTLISRGNDELALLRGIEAELITRADFVG